MEPRTNNYFRVGPTPFFFNTGDEASTFRAYDTATEYAAAQRRAGDRRANLVVWQRPATRGPWQAVLQIGECREPVWSANTLPGLPS